jgi:uncharacterized membrane protein YesL
MTKAFRIVWRSIVDVYGELFSMVGMNLIWVVLSLVVAFVFALPVALASAILAPNADLGLFPFLPLILLVVIGPNPVSAGLHNYASQVAQDERVEFSLFWSGLRKYWLRGLALFAISVLGTIVVVGNVGFYLSSENQILRIIGIILLYVTYFWLTIQIYLMPLLIEQENKSLKLVFRNAALLAADNPFFTLVVFLVIVIFSALSFVLPVLVMLLTGSLVAMIESRATQVLLEKYRGRTNRPG